MDVQFPHPDRSFINHRTSVRDLAAQCVFTDTTEKPWVPADSTADATTNVADRVVPASVTDDTRPAAPKLPGAQVHPELTVVAAEASASTQSRPPRDRSTMTVGIIGAGAAGLYAALILDSLNNTLGTPRIDFEILEANPERIGGRIYTHRFNGKKGHDAEINTPARYDYFDVGAMRFPDIPFMGRVFDLFERVGIDNLRVRYELSHPNNLKRFNGQPPRTKSRSPDEMDPFRVSIANGGAVPQSYVDIGYEELTKKVYGYYKGLFAKMELADTEERRRNAFLVAWNELVAHDHFSTRGYMLAGKQAVSTSVEENDRGAFDPLPESVVQWMETFDSATGIYDEAFVESVIDSLDFDWPEPLRSPEIRNTRVRVTKDGKTEEKEVPWYCLDGGCDRLTEAMAAKLSVEHEPQLGCRVTRITQTNEKDGMLVYVDGESQPREYSHVICTAPLGCMYHMDLDGCDLSYNQKQAIRSLQYDASVKVGLKFAKRWWEDPSVMGSATIFGGQSSTDLPIRVCVYPSYGHGCSPDTPPPGVLIASYTWAQDARRFAALAQAKRGSPSPEEKKLEKELLELVLDNLEKLHGVTREKMGPVEDFFIHSWYNDINARGAFALFGPAQFGRHRVPTSTDDMGTLPILPEQNVFTAVKTPASNCRFHIAGEATSIHHAWVLGALNSAWRAVLNATLNMGTDGVLWRAKLIAEWGIPDEHSEVHLWQRADLMKLGVS